MTETVAGALDAAALAELREGFRGEVVEPGDPLYDERRVVFNGMFGHRRPAAILRPTGTADVIRAIGLARLSGLPLAVRGGGHSVAGFSTTDGGIVLDLRGLRGIRVDPSKRTATVQAGLDWGPVDRETQQFGLAVTGGRVTNTGVAGFTLTSGSGWLERKLGLAADNLLRADLVTADGEVVVATPDENEDLFWGLCGGGGNFGVVTEFEFRLHPVGPIVYGGLLLFEPDRGREVLTTWRDICADAPDELGWSVASVTAPPAPFVPGEWQGKRVWGVLGMFAGSPDDGARIFEPLRRLGPFADVVQPLPYTAFQAMIDAGNPMGRRNYWRAHHLTDVDERTVDTMLEVAATIPSPFTALILLQMGGAIGRVSEDATAIGGRSSPFEIHVNGMWEGEAGDDANIACTRGVTAAFAPWIEPGISLNFQTEIGESDLRDSYGAKLERLRSLKRKYDPANLFRLNQNIAP